MFNLTYEYCIFANYSASPCGLVYTISKLLLICYVCNTHKRPIFTYMYIIIELM